MKKQEKTLIVVGILAVVGAGILYFYTRKTGIGISSTKTGTAAGNGGAAAYLSPMTKADLEEAKRNAPILR